MSVTIKELARLLNVSPATVSLALNGDSRVAEETSAKIKALANELDYVPNNFGRGLQSRKSRLAGYLAGSVTGSFFDLIMQGIGETAAAADYGLLTGITRASEKIDSQLKIFLEKNVDGIILSSNYSVHVEQFEKVERRKIPMVFCSTQDSGRHPFVITDNFKGGQLAAGHLISLGHRYLACCRIEKDRLAGNMDAIRRHNLPDPVQFLEAKDLAAVLEGNPLITGVTAYSDTQAIKVKHVIEGLGLRIPNDISIVGFDDMWFSDIQEFQFTTVAQPKKEIGQMVMQMLLELINGKNVTSKFMEPELVVRESTAPPVIK
jgi:DNA-binding LacI/PurR family transcriptional regulator